MDEFSFIKNLLRPLAGEGSLALSDDAASITVPAGQELILTKDALVRGVHFIGSEPASQIARKALRVNLSDCAAMGAKPFAYLMALMLPPNTQEEWLTSFALGLQIDQEHFGVSLLGGDTTRTKGELAISITMLGLVPHGKTLRRNGAKIGDDIYVSGTIGDAALGLHNQGDAFLLQRYQLPEPRIALGQKLQGIAHACMDISDGLVQDLGHICTASNVGAEIFWPHIPLSDAARACPPKPETILAGGDDYELLFTAPANAPLSGVQGITRIGKVTEGNSVKVLDENGAEILLKRKGYKHF